MATLFIDFETRSPIDLTKCGICKYAEDVCVILFAFGFDDHPVELWDCVHDPVMPQVLKEALENTDVTIVAHNSYFERTVLKACFNLDIPIHRWICTLVLARSNGLPSALKAVGEALKLSSQKVEEGKELIARFCKGETHECLYDRNKPNHREAWRLFGEYCKGDVTVTREIFKRLEPLSSKEQELWYLDQTINDRGYCVDVALAHTLNQIVDVERTKLDQELESLTYGLVSSSRCLEKLKTWLFLETGLHLEDLTETTCQRVLSSNKKLTPQAIQVFNNRMRASRSAVLKLNTLVEAMNSDGRLRGTLQFLGASRTGRWSGCVFPPQNLPRPSRSHEELDQIITHLPTSITSDPDPLQIISDCVRSCVIASEGKKLVVADLAGIEARVLAWMAGEQWKLKAFETGEDLYVTTYARSFNVAPAQVTKDQRAIGKVMELALGYQGGAKAFQKMASTTGLNLNTFAHLVKTNSAPEEWEDAENFCRWMQENHPEHAIEDLFIGTACERVKKAWRQKHSRVSELWNELHQAFEQTIENGKAIIARKRRDVPLVYMKKDKNNLILMLPSGRSLVYRDVGNNRSYLNTTTRQLTREYTYGGKLTENIVQAVSRDILAEGMMNATKAGYDIVLTVHDEIVCETPDTDEFNASMLYHLMTSNPSWAKGLPLKAEGYESKRYRK
ncbi:MAG: DNA polymerase [Candidatus Liberibacter asiaticus]|nr:DNA polymerase [Candidatus Liberibacter asiaticus]